MNELRYCELLIERAWRGRTLPLRRCRNLAAKGHAFCELHLRKLPVPRAGARQ